MNSIEALGIAIGAVRAQYMRIEDAMESPRCSAHQHTRYLEQIERFDSCLETLEALRQMISDTAAPREVA